MDLKCTNVCLFVSIAGLVSDLPPGKTVLERKPGRERGLSCPLLTALPPRKSLFKLKVTLWQLSSLPARLSLSCL